MSTPTLRFNERMSGYLSAADRMGGDFAAAYEAGRAQGTSIQFETIITHDDLPALLEDAFISGRAHRDGPGADAVPEPLGRRRRNLRAPRAASRRGRHRLDAVPHDAAVAHRAVTDVLPRRPQGHQCRVRSWRRGSTPPRSTSPSTKVTLPTPGAVRALGIMHIGLTDVHHLLAHAEVLNVSRATPRALSGPLRGHVRPLHLALLRRGAQRAGAFPGVAHASRRPAPGLGDGPVTTRRCLLCDPAGRWHVSGDVPDACSRLIRYRGGDKGPVMLASGFAMSATSMLTPTIHPNLVEFLLDGGYDVWLFDYRAGIDLPSADTQFTVDDIAYLDWPRAVDEVLAGDRGAARCRCSATAWDRCRCSWRCSTGRTACRARSARRCARSSRSIP